MEFQSEANLSLKLLSQYIRFSNRNLFAVEANYFQQRQILKFSALCSLWKAVWWTVLSCKAQFAQKKLWFSFTFFHNRMVTKPFCLFKKSFRYSSAGLYILIILYIHEDGKKTVNTAYNKHILYNRRLFNIFTGKFPKSIGIWSRGTAIKL